jgi:hypothetical protein
MNCATTACIAALYLAVTTLCLALASAELEVLLLLASLSATFALAPRR